MAPSTLCLAQFRRVCLSNRSGVSNMPSLAFSQVRCKSAKAHKGEKKPTGKAVAAEKERSARKQKKAGNTNYKVEDLSNMQQFSLCEAIRYIRAIEVGHDPRGSKYDLQIRLKAARVGPTIKNRIRLPFPVKTSVRVAVICPPDSEYAAAATAAGAVLVGEDNIFDAVKQGRIDFDACVCQENSFGKLAKSGIARILGPRALMPSVKNRTVAQDPVSVMRELTGAADYRERQGVISLAVGQLGFTPEELSKNIKMVMESVNKDIGIISEKTPKAVHEVVLSSSNSPGFSLNGSFQDANSGASQRELSTS